LLRARAFAPNRLPSETVTADYQLRYGTLAPPRIEPPGGAVTVTPVEVAIVGTAGVTLRYTLDGTDPTITSTIYTGPIQITSTTTVKARAFHDDWYVSALASAQFSVGADTEPPTITLMEPSDAILLP
jgi:hypothetical protein